MAAKTAQYGEDFDLVGTPDAISEGLHRYAEVGSQYVTFHLPDAQAITPIRLLGGGRAGRRRVLGAKPTLYFGAR